MCLTLDTVLYIYSGLEILNDFEEVDNQVENLQILTSFCTMLADFVYCIVYFMPHFALLHVSTLNNMFKEILGYLNKDKLVWYNLKCLILIDKNLIFLMFTVFTLHYCIMLKQNLNSY